METSIICTGILALAYFLAYFLVFVITFGPCSHVPKTLAVTKLAALNLHFVPMICALFLALQVAVDSMGTKMTHKFEQLMLWSTVAALVQMLLGVLSVYVFSAEVQHTSAQQQASEWARLPAEGGPLALQTQQQRMQLEDEARKHGDEPVVGQVTDDWLMMKRGCGVFSMTALRWIIMGFVVVIMAMVARELWHSPTCPHGIGDFISILTFVYFIVYLLLWLALVCGRKTPTGEPANPRALRFWSSAKNAVDLLCPLLAVLRVSWWLSGNSPVYNGT